jgi:AP-2 complex subunit beta-1/AP-1 complex subunit beta-1
MGETLKNEKTSVRKGCILNDCDMLNDIIISFKHIVSSYATALNEASNIMCDIIRKYKGISLQLLKYINSDLILNDISDSNSKSSLIYLLGEFCKEIKNSTQYLTELIELFDNETTNSNIKLQLLTSIVKNYVSKPDEGEIITKLILKKGAEEISDPDIRDRAYLYWRILESEPDIAKEMMNFEKKTFEFNEDNYYEDDLIDDMLFNFTNVSSVYHIHSENLQEKIIVNDIITQQQQPKTQNKQETNDDEFNEVIDLSDNTNTNNNNQTTSKSNEFDLLGLDLSNKEQTTTEQPTQTKKGGLMNDLMSIFG